MPESRFIDQFDVILFDLMDTLMFGGNRFSERENYAETYRRLGGTYLSDADVQRVLHQTWSRMSDHYTDPAHYDDFPPADTYLANTLRQLNIPPDDLPRLHDVFAHHELGNVPNGHCQALRELAQTHRLGLVSNLWSGKRRFVEVFHECGIHNLFDVLVFSSDYNSIKPAPRLFEVALGVLNVPANRVLFVGDRVERDVVGAAAVGMTPVLATPDVPAGFTGRYVPDVVALTTYLDQDAPENIKPVAVSS